MDSVAYLACLILAVIAISASFIIHLDYQKKHQNTELGYKCFSPVACAFKREMWKNIKFKNVMRSHKNIK